MNEKMRKVVDGWWWIVGVGVVVALFGFFELVFLLIGIFGILVFLLYVFAKGIEGASMMRVVSGKELREGDWLVEDVKVKGKVIKADWDGLSLEDISLMKKLKRVRIKEGLPFVPAFLIAFLSYVFFRDFVVGFLVRLA